MFFSNIRMFQVNSKDRRVQAEPEDIRGTSQLMFLQTVTEVWCTSITYRNVSVADASILLGLHISENCSNPEVSSGDYISYME